jgi:hypothetical protein
MIDGSALISWLSYVLIGLIACGTSLANELETKNQAMPEEVEIVAQDLIKAKLGSKYNTWEISLYSAKRQSYSWRIEYRFGIPEVPWVQGRIDIKVYIGSYAHFLPRITGAPDCINHPNECEFEVNEDRVETIAHEAGLEDGIRPWEYMFLWDDKIESYVWSITTWLDASPYGIGSRNIVIDANSGEVVCLYPVVIESIR